MTKKRLTPEDESALFGLRDRLILTIRFFEDVQEFPSGAQMRTIVEDAVSKRDMRTLRLVHREVDAMMIALLPHERDGLDAILHERLGVDIDAERVDVRRQVAAVIARGTVQSEKERRRLNDYVEMLEATGGEPAEIKAVRCLLRRS